MRTTRLPKDLSKGAVGYSVLETKSEQFLVLELMEKLMTAIKLSFFFSTMTYLREFGEKRAGACSVKAK